MRRTESEFQSTRPRGARLRQPDQHVDLQRVSIHAPARGATAAKGGHQPTNRSFNPRAREGRDHSAATASRGPQCFNPRAREGRDPSTSQRSPPSDSFQSTRPRGARLVFGRVGHDPVEVSIHAPARGATLHLRANLTANRVSIHAPARGATGRSRRSALSSRCFNPRAREGRDSSSGSTSAVQMRFQSTRPRGARRFQVANPASRCRCFNPRAREGRDLVLHAHFSS